MTWQFWVRTVEIEPRLNAGDPVAPDRQVEALLRTGCRLFHLDVADPAELAPGAAASAIADSIGPLLRRYDGVLDVHLELPEPRRYFGAVAAAGAGSVTFPFEAGDVAGSIAAAHENGLQAGVAFGPGAEPELVAGEASGVDLVLCRCEEGDGLESPLETIRRVRRVVRALPARTAVQVEGEVDHDNLRDLYEAGATVFVVGAPIYDREDLPRAYRRLVQSLA